MAEKKVKKTTAKAVAKAPKVVKASKEAVEAVEKEMLKQVQHDETVTEVVAPKETKVPAGAKSPEWIASASKQDLIVEFATKGGDTGSPEVQVALATHKILNLTMHLEQNPKDNHSRRGLLKVISKRRRILNYLNEKDTDRYKALIKKVNLTK